MSIYYNHFGVIWILLILVQGGIGKSYFLLKRTLIDNPMELGETFSNRMILDEYPVFTQYIHYIMEVVNIGIVILLFINFSWVCSLLYILNVLVGRFIAYALYKNVFRIGNFVICYENVCNSKYVYLFYLRFILLGVIFYNLFK